MRAADFVASYFEAWNQRDAVAVANHLAENGTYLDIPIHQEMTRDELIAHLEDVFAAETHRYELVGEVCSGANTLSFQYKAIPDHLEGEEAEAASWFGAEFMALQSGSALIITDYYDPVGETAPNSPVSATASGADVQRYAKSGLGADQFESLKAQLDEMMATQRLHLRPELTLPELAEVMNCSVNHLSQVINAGFGVSFFDYLNKHRVRDAMDLLADSADSERTVLNIALEVGFNSTSTFYVAFKKVTGQTPAQYRRERVAAQ